MDQLPPDLFSPYDEHTQPQVPIQHYAGTYTRNPRRAPFRRPVTRSEATGPLDLTAKLRPGDINLSMVDGKLAQGQLIWVSGRILDEDGRGVAGAIVEMWQANAAGRYFNPLDQRDAPLDPNFIGNGRCQADAQGNYGFFTIKPGAYPVPNSNRWWRPPHIHFSILGPASLSRLVTQMYFPGEPLNVPDLLILSIADREAQQRLISRPVPTQQVEGEWLAFRHDMVVRGRHATPPL